ncbi:MAG: glutaredoxin family protein [Myxococcaceae bacterium]
MTSESIPRRLVEVYSKPGCCLCTQALAAVEAVRLRLPFELLVRDVRQDAELSQRWRYDIPVVCIDGEVAFKGRLTEADFERRLKDGPGASSPARGRDGIVPASPE